MPLGTSIPVIVAPYGSFVIHRNIGCLQTLQQCRAECGDGVGEHTVPAAPNPAGLVWNLGLIYVSPIIYPATSYYILRF